MLACERVKFRKRKEGRLLWWRVQTNDENQFLAMSNYLGEILKSLGWEDGFQIPVANRENKELEAEVARLTLQRVKEKTTFETSTVKLENLENHLKYVKQESEQNQVSFLSILASF